MPTVPSVSVPTGVAASVSLVARRTHSGFRQGARLSDASGLTPPAEWFSLAEVMGETCSFKGPLAQGAWRLFGSKIGTGSLLPSGEAVAGIEA